MALRCSSGALRPECEGAAGLGDYFDLGRGSLDGTAASRSPESGRQPRTRRLAGSGERENGRTGGQSEAEAQWQARESEGQSGRWNWLGEEGGL